MFDTPKLMDKAIAVVLACLFGMSAHLTLKGGLGALPWCTTGNIVAICFHGVTVALDPNDDDGKKLLSNILLWVSFASGVALGIRHFQEGNLFLCICFLAGLLGINDHVFMKQNTAMEAAGVEQQEAGPVQACSSDLSVSSGPSVRSDDSMRHAAETYEAARASFEQTPYLSTGRMRSRGPSLGMQHQASLGMQHQISLGLDSPKIRREISPSSLKPISEDSEGSLELGAVRR